MRPKPKPWFPSWNDISKNEHTVNSQLIILKNSDWFGWCYNARKCNGYMVNRSHLDHKCEWTAQWREGWHVENAGKLQTLNLKHDCTRRKKKLLQHTSSFSVWTFENIWNLDNQRYRLCVCGLIFSNTRYWLIYQDDFIRLMITNLWIRIKSQ